MPWEFVALHPVQLVSRVAVPGEMENVAFAELAVTGVPPHPATMTIAETSSAGRNLRSKTRALRFPCVAHGSDSCIEVCAVRGKSVFLFKKSMAPSSRTGNSSSRLAHDMLMLGGKQGGR